MLMLQGCGLAAMMYAARQHAELYWVLQLIRHVMCHMTSRI
jgi:hypothetical protein